MSASASASVIIIICVQIDYRFSGLWAFFSLLSFIAHTRLRRVYAYGNNSIAKQGEHTHEQDFGNTITSFESADPIKSE